MMQQTSDTEPKNEAVPARVGAAPWSPSANQECGMTSDPSHDPDAAENESAVERIKGLPTEFGVMLVSVGVLGVVLPGVVGVPALVAGGLVLWPGTFSGLDEWLKRRNPGLYQKGVHQLGRFLNDLERRYPVSPEK